MDKFKQPRRSSGQRVTIDGLSAVRTGRRLAPVSRQATVRTVAQNAPAVSMTTTKSKRLRRPPAAIPNRAEQTVPHLQKADMSLPGASSLLARHPVFRRRAQLVRHWAFRTTIALLVVMVGAGGLLFAQGFFNAQKVFKGGATAAALQSNVDPNQLKGEGDGRINVLLLGIGGPGHDGSDLTDTIIIASIDPVNKTADLVSIPRDLWVQVPHHGSMKINAAYAMGKYDYLHEMSSSNADTPAILAGFQSIDSVVQEVSGIDVHYNVLLNFQAFRQAVDTVDGVTVNVPTDLYDPSMAWENDNNPLLARAGIQQFDGKHALIYVRSRHTSSDFARSERQRAVILAIKAKVATLGTLSNPVKIAGLIKTFGDNVVTDLSLNDAARLYAITRHIPDGKIGSIGLTDASHVLVTTGTVGSQSIVLPVAGLNHYDAIQTYLRGALPDGYITSEHARVAVLAPPAHLDQATAVASDLKSYGYNVTRVGTTAASGAPVGTTTQLFDLSHGLDKYTLHYLQQHFGTRAMTGLPAGSTVQAGHADFILVVGNQ